MNTNGNVEFQVRHSMLTPYPCFNNLVEASPNKYQIKGLEGIVLMVHSLLLENPISWASI